MLIAILSDVHRNAPALRAVLAAIDARQPDHVLALGEVERPKAVRKLLQAQRVEHADPVPSTIGGRRISVASETGDELASALRPDAPESHVERALARFEAEIVVAVEGPAGVRRAGKRLLVSPGSVGRPNDGDPRASFALVELTEGRDPNGQIVRVPYDLRKSVRAIRRALDHGTVTRSEVNEYLEGILERAKRNKSETLSRDDAGTPLLVKLLAHRAHEVYSVAPGDWPDDDLVHDWRVATRRLRETIALLSPVLRASKREQVARRAKRLARVLGGRRMADVLLAHLKAHHAAALEQLPTIAALLDRKRAKSTLRVAEGFPREKLLRHGVEVIALAMEPPRREAVLGGLAARHLVERADRVEPLLGAVDEPASRAAQHRLRIQVKHLRDTTEILAEAYPELISDEALIAPLRRIQDALGALNDADELLELLRDHRKHLAGARGRGAPEALDGLIAEIDTLATTRWKAAHDLVSSSAPGLLSASRALAQALEGAPEPADAS